MTIANAVPETPAKAPAPTPPPGSEAAAMDVLAAEKDNRGPTPGQRSQLQFPPRNHRQFFRRSQAILKSFHAQFLRGKFVGVVGEFLDQPLHIILRQPLPK